MGIFEIILLAVGLSMDAFAVAICKGLAISRVSVGKMALVGIWFGGFQALMPLIGYFLGSAFSNYITDIDHWIAFVLLSLIGANMIREALGKEETDGKAGASLAFFPMLIMAVATSIDALAVGVSFAFISINIIPAVLSIGVTTFIFSFIGVKIGSVFGTRYKSGAELAGGIILICLGLKMLLDGIGVI